MSLACLTQKMSHFFATKIQISLSQALTSSHRNLCRSRNSNCKRLFFLMQEAVDKIVMRLPFINLRHSILPILFLSHLLDPLSWVNRLNSRRCNFEDSNPQSHSLSSKILASMKRKSFGWSDWGFIIFKRFKHQADWFNSKWFDQDSRILGGERHTERLNWSLTT